MIKIYKHIKTLQTARPTANLLALSSKYFCNNEGKGDKQNNDQQSSKNDHENKTKWKFGFYQHPLYSTMRYILMKNLNKLALNKRINRNLKTINKTWDKQPDAAKTRTNKQDFQKDMPDDQKAEEFKNQINEKMRKILIAGIFLFVLSQLMSDNIGVSKVDQRKNIDFLLSQIENANEPINVSIQYNQRIVSQIKIKCEIGTLKKYVTKVNENELVYFLESLEKIRNGSVEVAFLPTEFSLNKNSKFISSVMAWIFMGALAFFGWRFFKKMQQAAGSMGIGNLLGNKKFEPVHPENIKISFQDVAGMHEAKFEITEFVDFLKKPDKYIQMGAKVPKGALLTGPPGTGKTLLAKACAGESGVPFFSVSGSDFVQKYSGLGAARVRNLFDQAQKNSPSIIFIDEIDAIGKKRDAGPFSNEERDNTLNQLLVRMDGFDTKNKVIVMAATNRKDMLDPALLRPGRFDRSVQIGLPSFEERIQILKVHLKKVKLDPNLSLDEYAKKLSRLTPGFSGAELANTCNQAAILSARENMQTIPLEKFEKATERVIAGLEKRNMFSIEQKEMLAFYQAGKAVANWFTQGADPVIKISILPFSKSKAGYSHSIKDETALHTKQELLARVCCYLAGRCAQQHFKGYVSTNGSNDLERAKKIISMIVTKFGMSQSLKMFAFPDFDFTRKPYSEKTQALIDNEIAKITEQCQKKVQQIIKSKEQEILLVKQKLLEKQTLSHNDIKQILGERPFSANETYQEYLKDQEQEQKQRIPQGPRAGVSAG